jgi:hypothetical protein
MRRRDQWIEWIRQVEREGETVAYAIELLQDQLRRDPSSLDYRGLGFPDFVGMRENREATYLLRLFAVFENGLREAWLKAERRTTQPGAADLLNAFAARCRMTDDRLNEAHRVRAYRNSVVHDESEGTEAVTLAEARRILCRFFCFLPDEW